jgi:hypothetical protein
MTTVTIAPFEVDSRYKSKIPPVAYEQRAEEKPAYWGVYLDGEYVSFVSSKELAEKTKSWMEKWLKD